MTERIVGVVLAGGRSARFGRDKLAEQIDGRSMLDHAIAAVERVAGTVFVVAPPDSAPEMASDARLVHDSHAFDGPLAGLASGLNAMDPAHDHIIVVGGDMPTLVPAVLRRLIDSLGTHEAAVLADDAGPRPLPIALRRSAASPAVERLLSTGERRLRALLVELDVVVVPSATWRIDDPDGLTLRDVDVPGDLPL
jgi:molybdopterin-guanine dinucleotide biosynthesis protein A